MESSTDRRLGQGVHHRLLDRRRVPRASVLLHRAQDLGEADSSRTDLQCFECIHAWIRILWLGLLRHLVCTTLNSITHLLHDQADSLH
jgi:hypothetical protein